MSGTAHPATAGTAHYTMVLGKPPGQPGAHTELAIRLADHVRRSGLVPRVEVSKSTISPSRYLHFVDPRGSAWTVRVSNHRKPRCTGRASPHLDLVSLDGVTGLAAAIGFIDRVISGEIAWFDPGRSPALRKGRR